MNQPWRTAVFEGAGALLWWDLTTGESGADVWDAAIAAGWLDAPRDLMREAAVTAWQEAWWPASRVAGVEPLDPRVLAARRASALAALDGITDDDEAAERALRELAAHVARLGPVDAPAPAARQEDYELAAGGTGSGGSVLREGTEPVDPGAVPQGVVDPLGLVAWRIVLPMTVEVTVPAAPVVGDPHPARLHAVADGATDRLTVPLHRTGGLWQGTALAHPALLAGQATFRLEAPGFPRVAGVDAHLLVEIARGMTP